MERYIPTSREMAQNLMALIERYRAAVAETNQDLVPIKARGSYRSIEDAVGVVHGLLSRFERVATGEDDGGLYTKTMDKIVDFLITETKRLEAAAKGDVA